jgi:hypothetical protein
VPRHRIPGIVAKVAANRSAKQRWSSTTSTVVSPVRSLSGPAGARLSATFNMMSPKSVQVDSDGQ